MSEVTIVVCAKNAERFVGRAIESAVVSEGAGVLLVDDFSDDDTVAEARRAGGDKLRVVRPRESLGLGNARQTGLESVEAEYLIWLDADDALLPGRVERMLVELRNGADLVFDAAELYDGSSGRFIKELPIPEVLLGEQGIYRSFERNFLPGPAWPGVRTEFALKIGYDPGQRTCDDLDFILRALLEGAKVKVLPEIGYRQFAYGDSLSRNLDHQRSYLHKALGKFSAEEVRALLLKAGLDDRHAHWALCSMSLFKDDFVAAKRFAEEAFSGEGSGAGIGDAWGVSDAWLEAFAKGTIGLLLGGKDEEGWLDRSLALEASPDVCNNLGVALWRRGDRPAARGAFESALRSFPGYLDATRNLSSDGSPTFVTSHPLRRELSRSEY